MKKNTQPLLPDTYYHIYNRGVNKGDIFREDKNYNYFLHRYSHYIYPIAHTYAYCLLKNHFHILIKTRKEGEILANNISPSKDIKSRNSSQIISKKFAHLFNSYTQAYNKLYERTGSLFETPFRRVEVSNEKYFTQLVYYIHSNPEKHGISDLRTYPYSSFLSHLSEKKSKLERDEVLNWFGSKKEYILCHTNGLDLSIIDKFTFKS